MLVEFGRIFGLMELGGLFRCKIDINRNFRLVDLSGFSKF